jgi:hypothetical protein
MFILALLTTGLDSRAEEKAEAKLELPSGEAVLDKYIEATGGRATYEKRHNAKLTIRMEMPAMGVKASMLMYSAMPNKLYAKTEMPGMGKSVTGTDGKTVWQVSDLRGPVLIEGKQRDSLLREAVFNSELHWKKLYKSVECVGTETVGDKPCYKVVMTAEDGPPRTSYFDKETGLMLKQAETLETPMGPIPSETLLEDYRNVDGILVAHRIIQKAAMQEQVMTIESAAYNVDIPKDQFSPPPEITALMQKPKEKAGGPTDAQGPGKPQTGGETP